MRHFYLLNHQKFDSNIFMIHFFLCIFEHFHSLRGGTSTLSVLENQKNEMFSLGLFEYGKVKGGRLVNEADFEAKTKIFQQKNLAFQLCFYVSWHFSHQKCLKTNISLLSAPIIQPLLTTMAFINPPKSKLAKGTSVLWSLL